MSINRVMISGNLTRDAEIRSTQSGMAILGFGVAVNDRRKNQQTGEKEVDFLGCTAFGAAGENAAKYFRKGQMAIVTGRLQIRQYTDKNGQKRRHAEILVSNVYFYGSKESGTQASSGADNGYSAPAYQTPAPATNFVELEDDDAQLPF